MAGMPLGPLVALDNTAPMGEWAVAYGLALRSVSSMPEPAVPVGRTEVAHA